MKLLVVSHSCSTAINQQVYAEIERQTGWNLTVVVPANWQDEFGNVLDEPAASNLKGKVRKVSVWGNGSIIFHAYRFRWRAFLEREGFDAIYMNHEPYALATAQVCLANRRIRRPAAFGFYSCQNIRKKYPVPFRWSERMVYRESRFAFPISEAVETVLRDKGFGGKMTVSPLPLDPAIFYPRHDQENQQLIPRAPGELVLGFVGRLTAAKGLRTLARALGELPRLRWKLLIIGKGDFEGEFRELIGELGILGRVQFLGYVPHLEAPRYLSAMDLLVVPSETQRNWKEQFGRVITEALACGTAVVGSDSGEIPNLIRQSGGGVVFPEKDVPALADAIRRMIEDPELRQSCAARGRDWVVRKVSVQPVAASMVAIIEQCVGKSVIHASANT